MDDKGYDTKHIKVLDGIRAIAILIIVWYHIWQQSWLSPNLSFVSLEFIPRYGFLLVDVLILLSSFCLFIPYARSKIYKEEVPDTKKFYIKRIARIFPSYYLSLIIAIILLLIGSKLTFNSFFIKDTLMHIFFVQNWSIDTIIATNYFGVLWTVALEVQFYVLFPFIAKRFIKKPIITYITMTIVGVLCTYIICKNVDSNNIRFYVNHFLTFITVYANGMLACWFYLVFTKKKKRNIYWDILFTILSIIAVGLYVYLCRIIDPADVQTWQLNHRIMLSLVFTLFIVSTCLASKIYQKIFNNKLLKFIATISFNLFIYHAIIAIKLKEWRIPFYIGDNPPNFTGDKVWQWKYTILCFTIAIVVAILMTYLVEKPLAKLIRKKYKCDM